MSASLKSSARHKGKRRPGDPWVSKNRVLNGGTGKAKRSCNIYRNPNFDTDETKMLIQFWGDPKVQRELITTHKKHVVISQLSAKMEEYGYYRSPEEIMTRIKNMKCFYNRLKKDMESSKNMDPSWRHYAEMDAIMTRPIFSVRPNEVPAPSLKYLLEQEQEKRQERKRKAEEEGSSISDSDEDISDMLAVSTLASKTTNIEGTCKEATNKQTSCEAEFESVDKTSQSVNHCGEKQRKHSNEDITQKKAEQTISDAIKLEFEAEQFQEYQSLEESDDTNTDAIQLKKADETIKTINVMEDEDLLVPKLELIDVDEEYEKQRSPPTAKTTTIKQNYTTPQLADIFKQPAKTQNMRTPSTMFKFILPANSAAAPISSANSSTTSTPSKISVVSPTILMPSQMSAKSPIVTASMDQRQLRLPGNLHALLAASGSRTTVTNTNGMKFLLLNTADQRGPPITTSNLTSAIPLTGTNQVNSVGSSANVKIIQNTTQKLQQQQMSQQLQPNGPQNSQLLQQQQSSPSKPKETVKRTDARQDYREQLKKRDLLGIKTTLLKMVEVQEDANEIQSERLAIERERLQFERSIADRFLSLFEQNQKIQQQLQQQLLLQQQLQHQSHIQLQQKTTTSPQVFTTTNSGQTPTVTPNSQIMLPPKLLITTMVPTSSAQAAAGPTAKVLTTTGFTNLTSTTSNSSEMQLVVPKEEPQN